MFNFLEARMATMLRTSSGLLRMARRHLRDDLRDEEELMKKDIPKIQQAAKSGKVDVLKKDFLDDTKDFEELLEDLEKMEKDTFIAEFRSLDEMKSFELGFTEAKELLRKLHGKHPEFESTLKKLWVGFEQMEKVLHEEEQLEGSELHNQYINVLRQAKGNKGQVQSLVFSVNEVMTMMDELWNLRGEVRKEGRVQGDIMKDEKEILHYLSLLQKEQDKNKQKKYLKKLQDREEHLEKSFKEFATLFKKVELGFTLVMKVCTDIFFKFKKDWEFFPQFILQLIEDGFPEGEQRELQEVLRRREKEGEENIGQVLAVVRRGSRLSTHALAA